MRTKRDYSRLVAIDLSPTEAAILFGYLRTSLSLLPNEVQAVRDNIEGIAKKLFKQLHGLDWPMDGGSFFIPLQAAAEPGAEAAEASASSPASTKP